MTFAREKRLLLALLAALAPLPLPFNDNLAWPILVAFVTIVGLFVVRVRDGADRWLPDWALNVLGGVYLPLFALDLMVWGRGQLVRPVLHLILYVVAVKLFAMRRERDKWHVLLGVLFVFLAGMGTSVHPAMVAYMAVMLGLFALALLRFAQWSVLAGVEKRGVPDPTPIPVVRLVVAATVVSLLLAIPLFALLPRVGTPFLMGRGQGTGTVIQAAGFTDVVSLDVIGSIRQSREVVLRLESEGPPIPEESLRFKAATYGLYDGRSWRRERGGRPLFRDQATNAFEVAAAPVVRSANAWLQPLGSTALPLPLQTASVEIGRVPTLEQDPGGGLRLWLIPEATISMRLGLAGEPISWPEPPTRELLADDLYLSGLTVRMAELASRVAGDGPALERATRLEAHLATEYEYTTEFVGVSGDDAIDEFLFEHRRGHCEYFASSLVVLLRAEGIPSRLVTGFLGAEFNPLEGYYIVRQLNAHAWVEAWIEAEGRWVTLDPTPAAGRPRSEAAQGFGELFGQSWDYLLFRWERYVLTFGVEDQLDLLRALRQRWRELVESLRGDSVDSPAGDPVAGDQAGTATDATAAAESWQRRRLVVVGLTLVLCGLLGTAWWWWRRPKASRGPLETYATLRTLLERAGLGVGPATAPLELERLALAALPEVAGPVRRLVRDYIAVAFAGRTVATAPEILDQALVGVREALAQRARRQSKARASR